MSEEEAKQLLIKYQAGHCTDAEEALVERWLFGFNNQAAELSVERIAAIKAEVREQLPQPVTVPVQRTMKPSYWISIAATLLVVAGTAIYFFSTNRFNSPNVSYTEDIRPGGNSATLTLADGKTIVLSAAKSGVVIKADQLTYNDGAIINSNAAADTAMSTITTPRGGQYNVELPDGSKILLNAASTLKFPAIFRGSKRKVRLSGEAYFEIVKDQNHPFIVETEKQTVEVLGTHFNINSYQDEQTIKTTLLEGSVKVSGINMGSQVLKPGEQSVNNGSHISVSPVDTELVMDWKNGDFIFKEEPLNSLMHRISRWYNVTINYTGNVDQHQTFTGKVSRTKNISEILKALSNAGQIKFSIEGNTISVKN